MKRAEQAQPTDEGEGIRRRAQRLVEALAAAGVDIVASLPDTQITPMIRLIAGDSRFTHVPLTREDDGVGVCAGAYLGGSKPCLLLQNSGLLEALNDLLIMGVASEIPMLLLIGYRGTFGERHWYHGPAGRVTTDALKLLGIEFRVLNDVDQASQLLCQAQQLAKAASRPVGVLLTLDALGVEP